MADKTDLQLVKEAQKGNIGAFHFYNDDTFPFLFYLVCVPMNQNLIS